MYSVSKSLGLVVSHKGFVCMPCWLHERGRMLVKCLLLNSFLFKSLKYVGWHCDLENSEKSLSIHFYLW